MPEIRKMLVVSTAHLGPATLSTLNDVDLDRWGFSGAPTAYGFFLYAHDERPKASLREVAMPDEIWTLCCKARALGCDYILVDRDAEPLEDIPVFDH